MEAEEDLTKTIYYLQPTKSKKVINFMSRIGKSMHHMKMRCRECDHCTKYGDCAKENLKWA
jgi:hypothetical protein